MFTDLTKPREPRSNDGDFRGIFDPTNFPMFKRYESGYNLFFILDIPIMLNKLATTEIGSVTKINYKQKYANLINSYIRTLEREFRRLDGLDNISSDSIEFTGLNEVSVKSINKVVEATNVTISMPYIEPYGSVISRVHELFLKGIDDPIVGRRKTYNGLIDDGILAPSFKNEVFKFLYIVTDNTGLRLEKAFLLFNAQPTSAFIGDLYNAGRGEIENKEITYEFNCNVLSNRVVNNRARAILEAITGFHYDETTDTVTKISTPVFQTNYSSFDEYRALTDDNEHYGPMNFPTSSKDMSYIQAYKRYGFEDGSINTTNMSNYGNSINKGYSNVVLNAGTPGGQQTLQRNYDYNRDGKFDKNDPEQLLKDIVSDKAQFYGDYNEDGYINAKDSLYLLKKLEEQKNGKSTNTNTLSSMTK